MATIILPNGVKKTVNLGWLLRHARDVVTIEICPQHWFKEPAKDKAARMMVRMNDQTLYMTDWSDLSVCRDWLKRRRVFTNVTPKFWL